MRGKMQYAILHNSSKRLIATLELPKFFWHSNFDIFSIFYDMYFITDCVANSISDRNLASIRMTLSWSLSAEVRAEKRLLEAGLAWVWLHQAWMHSLLPWSRTWSIS